MEVLSNLSTVTKKKRLHQVEAHSEKENEDLKNTIQCLLTGHSQSQIFGQTPVRCGK